MIDCLPLIKLNSLERIKATEYKIKIEKKVIDNKLKEISKQNKQFKDKKEHENQFWRSNNI